jgi:hypothetical protein
MNSLHLGLRDIIGGVSCIILDNFRITTNHSIYANLFELSIYIAFMYFTFHWGWIGAFGKSSWW